MLRIAIHSTPRSGNTWLRFLLRDAYQLQEIAVHSPGDVDWDNLPGDVVLQLHWHRTPEYEAVLKKHGFQVIVLTRHPFDVLISLLHYRRKDRSKSQALMGESGGEESISNVSPCSREFLSYATSERAKALMSVSREWWPQATGLALARAIKHSPREGTRLFRNRLLVRIPIKYEDLVEDTARQLGCLERDFGVPKVPANDVVTANQIDNLRPLSQIGHFWQGKPGLWRSFLTADIAKQIYEAHSESFRLFGYQCDPDESLDESKAEEHWLKMA